MLTRKDFEILANVINDKLLNGADYKLMLEIAEEACINCLKSNPRFNRELFLKACGFEADEKLV